MSSNTLWQKVKTGSKTGFDKAWKAADKLGTPVNNLTNKLGSEAFWPTTLDKESDKAARILKSFCKDGFYAEEDQPVQDGPKQKQKVFKKIPSSVIKNAKGLAIFTTMRTGLWFSGAGGSGILIARKEDGTWSPPSGILLHTAGLGFLVGVDIYDCVVVINSEAALDAFTKIRCTLGSEISVAAGPVGAGGVLDTEIHKRQAPIFTYLKSRGFYAGVQIDGTVIIERKDENERFYGYAVPVKDILAGKIRHPPFEVRRLLETVRAAQGDRDVDESILPTEAPPGDFEVIDEAHIFGVPDREDPDPYGVLALEKEGMSVKEAGTQKRASWESFNFNPSPSSPVHDMVRNSNSHETPKRSSWRSSAFGGSSSLRNSIEQRRSMADMSTQTDETTLASPQSPSSAALAGRRSHHSPRSSRASLTQSIPEHAVLSLAQTSEPESASKANGYSTPPHTPPLPAARGPPPALPPRELKAEKKDAGVETATAVDGQHDEDEDRDEEHNADDDSDDEDDENLHDESAVHYSSAEPAVVHSIQTAPVVPTHSSTPSNGATAVSPQMISKPRIVDVPKRVTPRLPPRNPNRGNGPVVVDASPATSSREVSPEKEEDVAAAAAAGKESDNGEEEEGKDEIKIEDHDARPEADAVGDEKEEEEEEEEEPLKTNPFEKADALRQQEEEEAKKGEEESVEAQEKEGAAAMPGGW